MVRVCVFGIVFLGLFLQREGSGQEKMIVDVPQQSQPRSNKERISALYEAGFHYIEKDKERALNLIGQARQVASLTGDSVWIVKCMRVQGQLLYKLERIEEAIQVLKPALVMALKHNLLIECPMITNTLGSSYLFEGKFDRALQYYLQSLEFAQGLKDTMDIIAGLHNIGLTFYKLGDYTKSLDYLHRSDCLAKLNNFQNPNTLTNISLCYSYLNDFATSELYLEESMKACGRNCPDNAKMQINYARGVLSYGLKEYEKAEEAFRHSYIISKKLNDARFQLDNIHHLIEICIVTSRMSKVELFLQQANRLTVIHLPFNMEVLRLYSRLYEFYLIRKDYKTASHYQSKYIELKDSIYNLDMTTQLMRTEAAYLEKENKAKIDAQHEIILLKERIISRQYVINIITWLLVFVVIGFLLLLFKNFRQKLILNDLLEKKIKERTQELETSRDILLKTIREKDLRMTRTAVGMVEITNSIKGLCATGSKDVTEEVALGYLRRINESSACLLRDLKAILHGDLLMPPS